MIRIQNAIKGKGNELTKEDIRSLKLLFHLVPQLNFIPKSLWNTVITLFTFKELPPQRKVIRVKDKSVYLYIVLTGELVSEGDKVYLPGDIFGNTEPINNEKWIPKNIVARTEVGVIMISPTKVASLIEQANINHSHKELLNFLDHAIPKFDQLSGNLKYTLAKLFIEKVYMPGTHIVTEGHILNSAYLIKEGRCKIISSKEQTSPNESTTGRYFGKRRSVTRQSGYTSTSINRYQIKTIGASEWLGEEILFGEFGWKAIDYSAIAIIKTRVLSISKDDLNKFPFDVLSQLRSISNQKVQWRTNRKAQLSNSIMKIHKFHSDLSIKLGMNSDNSFIAYNSVSVINTSKEFYTAAQKQVSRRLPFTRKEKVNQTFNYKTVSSNTNLSQKRKLEVAATFKTLYKKTLYATFTFRSQSHKFISTPKLPLPLEKRNVRISSRRVNSEFVVGVKGVRIIDVDGRKPPPSPNLARIHAN